MACRWFLMVPSATPSCIAISLLLSPLAAARATWNCRRVRVSGSLGEAATAGPSPAACSPNRRLPPITFLTQALTVVAVAVLARDDQQLARLPAHVDVLTNDS